MVKVLISNRPGPNQNGRHGSFSYIDGVLSHVDQRAGELPSILLIALVPIMKTIRMSCDSLSEELMFNGIPLSIFNTYLLWAAGLIGRFTIDTTAVDRFQFDDTTVYRGRPWMTEFIL